MRGGWLDMMADRYRGAICTAVTADIARSRHYGPNCRSRLRSDPL
jgi:hypothetical protein